LPATCSRTPRDDVVGLVPVAGDAAGDTPDHSNVAAVERAEGIHVAVANGIEDCSVVGCRRVDAPGFA